jgi:hypothetical protein
MIKLSNLALALQVSFSSAFAFQPPSTGGSIASHFSNLYSHPKSSRRFVTRDEYLQPHFEPSKGLDMDRILFCAETNGECSMSEMVRMMEGKKYEACR